ncbi:hypothetical protein JCM10212_005135 [Sporobolomyces blumeae]
MADPTPSTSFTAAAAPPHAEAVHQRHFIQPLDQVVLKLPSGQLKPIKVLPDGKVSLGKYGSFKTGQLVNRVYGQTYEILSDGTLEAVQATLNEIEETAANNEHIESTGAQNLTFVDIQALKDSGMSGREIIQKQIEEHKSYELKTEYSKEKYMKRKEAKYIPIFTPLAPTIHQLTDYNFERTPSKTRDLRPDTLANLLAMANVRPGSRLLVVENVGGLIVGACVERMGGTGRIMVVNDADSPPDLHLVEPFNFSATDLEPIHYVHWAATEPSWTPPELPLEHEAVPPRRVPSSAAATTAAADEGTGSNRLEDRTGDSTAAESEVPSGTEQGQTDEEKEREMKRLRNLRNKVQREAAKLKKRRATFEKAREMRDEFFAGEYDGLIIASEYEPHSIIERLIPFLAGSASIVVYSPYIQPLNPALMSLRSNPLILHPTIHEPFLRRYQVLPGRTHPEMQGMSSGGFLLSATRVVDLGGTNSVNSGSSRRRAQGTSTNGKEKDKADDKGRDDTQDRAKEQGEKRSADGDARGEGLDQADEKRRKVETSEGTGQATSVEMDEDK